MCGRAVQTRAAIRMAKQMLLNSSINGTNHEYEQEEQENEHEHEHEHEHGHGHETNPKDNYNLSPGMKSIVLVCQHPTFTQENTHTSSSSSSSFTSISKKNLKIVSQVKVWGVLPKSGTIHSPLPKGPSKHFQALMFNARSDTLFEKKTFRTLAIQGNSCIWPMDGFYEWNEDEKDALHQNSYKQPFYFYSRDHKPLLIAGLYKHVSTGFSHWSSTQTTKNNMDLPQTQPQHQLPQEDKDKDDKEPSILPTFTMLTTEACSDIYWIQDRLPVILWDAQDALEWLYTPSQEVKDKIASKATQNSVGKLQWHPVHKRMTDIKYNHPNAMEPIRIEKIPSVKSFFFVGSSSTQQPQPSQSQEIFTCHVSKDLKSESCCTSQKQQKNQESTFLDGTTTFDCGKVVAPTHGPSIDMSHSPEDQSRYKSDGLLSNVVSTPSIENNVTIVQGDSHCTRDDKGLVNHEDVMDPETKLFMEKTEKNIEIEMVRNHIKDPTNHSTWLNKNHQHIDEKINLTQSPTMKMDPSKNNPKKRQLFDRHSSCSTPRKKMNDLDPSVLSELPQDIAEEVLKHKYFYVWQSNRSKADDVKSSLKQSPKQGGIDTFFVKK